MKGNEEVLTLLNNLLTNELTAINQYFIHAKMCENWGYERLAHKIREESIDEMKHADVVISRILFLEGVPNWQRLLFQLLREVVLLADLANQLELLLDPIGVLFLGDEDALEQILRRVVMRGARRFDTLVEERDRRVLELQVALELLADRLADVQLVVALQVRHALEEQDAADHLIGVLHLVDRLLAQLVSQPLVTPVLTHLAVDEILVDRSQLVEQQRAEELQNVIVPLHGTDVTAIV